LVAVEAEVAVLIHLAVYLAVLEVVLLTEVHRQELQLLDKEMLVVTELIQQYRLVVAVVAQELLVEMEVLLVQAQVAMVEQEQHLQYQEAL
jgi:hypothetical protein